ncbi:MAG: aminotransferase class III-fold pyridoxal phosphate-dependent enzyme, partial [Vicinamibacteria bacterium]
MTTERNLESLDRRYVFHPSTHLANHERGASGPWIVDGGKGIRIFDRGGAPLIDAFAGLYCVNVGYGRQEVAEAIYEQAKKLAYYHTYAGHSNEPIIRLSERVLGMAPPGMSKIYYGLSGSDANETQVKLVWYFNNVRGRSRKKKIISRHRGYHGASVMSGSLTGLPLFHQAFDLPLPQVRHTVAPHHY